VTSAAITDDELVALEDGVQLALQRCDPSMLDLLGEGEISLVLRAGSSGQWACKRLPPFPSFESAERYGGTIDRYVAALRQRSVDVVATDLRQVVDASGATVLYCVQPVLPASVQAVSVVGDDPSGAPTLLADIVETIFAAVDEQVGLDAQLSNWAVVDGRLRYFDVTTPLLREQDGTSQIDTEVFLASMPWVLRPPVRRFVVPGIIDRYHEPRSVARDLAANLIKEGLDDLVPVVVDEVNHRAVRPLTVEEVQRDRRSDARTWELLQAIRRVDRVWQRRVRRRTYPFLLPTRAAGAEP
jgi:hypothetical protein